MKSMNLMKTNYSPLKEIMKKIEAWLRLKIIPRISCSKKQTDKRFFLKTNPILIEINSNINYKKLQATHSKSGSFFWIFPLRYNSVTLGE